MTSCKYVEFSSLLCCYVRISGPSDLLGRALCVLFIGWVDDKRRRYLRKHLTSSTGSVWQYSGHSPFKHVLSDLRNILLFELLVHPLFYLSLDLLGYGFQCRDHVCRRVAFSAEVLLEILGDFGPLVYPLSGDVEAELEVVELLIELTIVVLQTQVSADFVPFS
jgi:hypothetical protein